nr:hypothetical protein [Tanacetum cinerariifolium]
MGYNVVPPPAADLYISSKKDLSWTGLPEFVDDTVTDYSRPSPTVASTSSKDQNKDTSISEEVASTNPSKPFVKFVKPKDSQSESKLKEQETPKKPQLGPEFVLHKKLCFNCGDFSHLAKDCRRWVQRETIRSQNHSYKSSTHRSAGHRQNGAHMRPLLRSSSPRPHGNSMRPPFRPAGHRPHGPSMNPRRPTMNGARTYKTFFQTPSFETRPFLKSLAVNNSYRAPWGSSQNNIDDKGYRDSGCSRHMTGNISYLSNFEPFDGGYVSFVQGGRKITGKGTIKIVGESSPNPTTSNPKFCNRRRLKQRFILEESPVDTMADQRAMAELLRAPTEGYAEAIVVLPILAEQFELKHSLINMMTSDQFFGLEKDNPHYHILVPLSELEKIKKMNEINIKAMQTQINNVKNELSNEMKTSIQALMSNQTNELKNMMASFFQMNTVSTSGSGPLPKNTIANPKVVILKKLPEKLGDPGKFLILCGFSELKCKTLADLALRGNKMHKAFPLPVIEFPLAEEFPTASEESCHFQKKREATAVKIALLDSLSYKSSPLVIVEGISASNHLTSLVYIALRDSYVVPASAETTDTASDGAGKKKGKTVTLTTEDMQKRKNDVKARTTLLLSLPDEHQLWFSKHKTAQELWVAILKTFGGNEATKKTKKNLLKQQYGNFKAEGSETLEQTFNKVQMGHYARECRAPRSHDRERRDNYRQGSKVEEQAPKALMAIDVMGWDWSYMENDEENHALVAEKEAPIKFALMANTSAESKSQRLDKNKEGLGYSVVPPPPAQIYSSLKKDMSWTSLPEFKDDIVTDYSRHAPTVESSPNDAQNRYPSVTKTEASISIISPKSFIKFVKAKDSPTKSKIEKAEKAKKSPVKYAKQYRKPTHKPNVRENQRNWKNLKSHQLGPNFEMKKNAFFNCGDFNHLAYDYRKRVKQGTSRSQNNTHKSFTPRPTVHKPYRPPMRPVRSNMNGARPNRTSFNKPAHSYTNRPFQRTSAVRSQYRAPRVPTINKKFPPVNRKLSTVSRNFSTVNRKFPTANRKFLTGGTKFHTADMGKKGKVVKSSAYWFWKPSQNLSNKGPNNNSVSVMFKKYTYIDTQGRLNGCSRHMTGNISYLSDFEPFDGGYMSFGQGGCNITGKGTIKTGKLEFENVYFMKDLKRLGHLNFKTMNKLVRHNLLRGLPTKCFENDHTYTACLKGKQYKASCTSKLVNSDETSGILRKFITEIENLKDLKVKIIREFSNARTPQLNGVAERRNRTLIEVARTMLADAKLAVTFWAKAVNTACYVQNRVLVNKSQNKTLYELFNGRTPTIGFLKPFSCHVMILNTLDNLGKFEEKGDECYFFGYSMSSKAFRVFNKRTRRVEENLHVEFLENKAIEKGAGPNWLFDIDSLTKSMNYVPVDAGTNSTNISGKKDAASQEVEKDVSSLIYIVLPNWVHDALLESSSSKPQDDCSTDVPESSGNSNPTAISTNPLADQLETLTVETPIPTISSPVLTACFTDSPEPLSDARLISKGVANQVETPSLDNILTLTNQFEDILGATTNSVDSDGVEADVSNMETTITASPTPILRIHQDHPKSQIIGPMDTPIQTRNKSKETLAGRSYAGRASSIQNPEFYQMDVKSAFLYGTIDEEVYEMQPPRFQDLEFPARGYIDQTLFIRRQRGDFILVQVYVNDIIFGSSNPQLCREFEALMYEKFQMSAMGELNFFLGLQVLQKEDGIFLSQEKYVGNILKKFGYSDVRSSNTPMDKENLWGKDRTRKVVDLHLYRSMIRSLMYLTSSRPDIMFTICTCTRHQVTPKECHLHAVKRIFIYLKGHPKLGLWYPKESPFDLVAYSDSDYGCATQDRKSTTEGSASYCGQVLWIQNQLLDYGLRMPCEALSREILSSILRFNTIMVRLQFCNYHNMVAILEKSEHNVDFYPIVDFVEASPLSSNIATALECLATNRTYNFSKMIFDGLVKNVNNKGEGLGTLTKPHHIPSLEAHPTSHTTHSLPTHPPVTTASIPTVTPSETIPIRQYTRRTRIAQSSALSPIADEPASPLRDVSQGKACPTDSDFGANQDRENIAKTSTLPYDSAPMVTSPAAAEGSVQQTLNELTAFCTSLQRQHLELIFKFEAHKLEINRLKARVKLLEDREGVDVERSGDNAPINGRNLDEGEAEAERVSDDTEKMAAVLTFMDAATVLASRVVEVPTGSGSIPTAGPPAAEVPTGSDVVPTASLIFATATMVTPYTRRKGKETMLEEEMERDAQRMNEQIARDAEIARIHAEEELQIMIDGLDRSNETVAKYLQKYHQFATELPLERRIELISDLVKYQDNYAKLEDFIPMGSKEEDKRLKRKCLNLDQESVKKLKTSEEVAEEAKSPDEVPEEKVKEMMQLVPIEEVYVEALQVKHPIIDWKVYTEGQRAYWKITRLGGSLASYQFFIDLLKHLDREDLNQLWALVKESLSNRPPTSDKEIEIWVELKRLCEPDDEDQLWTHTQNLIHAPVEWMLYDTCGVHHVTAKDKKIFMLVEKDYPLRKGLAIGMISYKL